MYNLVNTIASPTRITRESSTLVDVIVTNKQANKYTSMVMDLGYSDHWAQMLKIHIDSPNRGPIRIRSRKYTKGNIDEFNHLLQKELWQESLSASDVNTCFNAFMDTMRYHFNTAFPLKTIHRCNLRKNNWITQGIRKSCKRIRVLNSLKKQSLQGYAGLHK
jgi:hypothetical protein